MKVVSFKYMEESIARLEKAVDKCIENARHAGTVSGALMVIAQLNLSRKEGISLLAKSIGISKKEATEYYDECIVR